MSFEKWLDTLVEEKGLDTDHVFEVDGPSGPNYIPLAVVIENIKITTWQEQQQIGSQLTKRSQIMKDVSLLAFYGYHVDYTHMSDGFILVKKPWGCVTDEDIDFVKKVTDASDYMVWKSDYQIITIG